MLYTIVQIVVFQALFLLVYDVFLRRNTFFNCNRVYLLITALLSIGLPFVKFPKLKQVTTKDLVIQLPEVFLGVKTPTDNAVFIAEQAGIVLEQPQIPFWQILLYVGIGIAALLFVVKIAKLYWLVYRSPKRWKGNILIVKLLKSSAAFSFFNTIFLGDLILETQRDTIYKHELVHVKQKHTIDLMLFEVLRILFWYNPLVYIYQNRIKELHEFIADAKAVKDSGKAMYYNSLLNQIFDVQHLSFTNTFFKKSLIKKRIAMLQKSKSSPMHLLKYALLLPLVFGMLIYTSTEVRAQEKKEKVNGVTQELTEEQLIKKYYDEIIAMKKNGATFFEIADYAGFGKSKVETYFVSKEKYLKFKAYFRFIADEMIERKSEEGTLTDADFHAAENMIINGKSYTEYLKWKGTKEAQDLWEANIKDGERKLFVTDLTHKTETEEKRYDALLKQLENDSSVNKLIVTDGKSTLILDDYKSNKTIEKDEVVEIPFNVIENVPTTTACKDLPTNHERKQCMNSMVQKHVAKHFNIDLAKGLSPGKKRVFVQFKVGVDGYINDVKARGPSVLLEEEAKRVIRLLPQFIPGRQSGKTVIVPYALPIVFEVAGEDPRYDQTPKYKAFIKQLKQKGELPTDKKTLLELYLEERLKIQDSLDKASKKQ